MIALEDIREVMERLLERTRSGRAKWSRDYESGVGCLLRLPMSAIAIDFEARTSDPSRIRLSIYNDDDFLHPISEFVFLETESDWELARELHREAGESAYGWKEVLADIRAALDSAETIGIEDASLRGTVPT